MMWGTPEKQHWVYFLPDVRPTFHVSHLLGQIAEKRSAIESAERRITDLDRFLESRVLDEYSVEEVAQAKALADHQPNAECKIRRAQQ